MTEFLWHERLINSTIGIPQQLTARFARSITEAKSFGDFASNLFSERGWLDRSLIPGIGFFDKDRQDVAFEDTARAFGFKNAGFGLNLAMSLVDPALLTGSGLTKGALLARNIGKVENAVGKSVLRGLGSAKAADAAGLLREGLSVAHKAGRIRTKDYAKQLSRVDDIEEQVRALQLGDETVEAVRKSVEETAPLFGLSAIVGSSKLAVRVPTKHSGWFTMMGAASVDNRLTRAMGSAYHGVSARNIPLLSPMFRSSRTKGALGGAGLVALAGGDVVGAGFGAAGGALFGPAIGKTARVAQAGLRSSGGSRFARRAGSAFEGDEEAERLGRLAAARGGGSTEAGVIWANDHVGNLDRMALRLFRDERFIRRSLPPEMAGKWWADRVQDLSVGKGVKGKEPMSPEDILRIMLTSEGPAKGAKKAAAQRGKMRGLWKTKRKELGLDEAELTVDNLRRFGWEVGQEREIAGRILDAHNLETVASSRFDPELALEMPKVFELSEKIGAGLRKSFLYPGRFEELKKTYDTVRKTRQSLGATNDQMNALMSRAIKEIAKKKNLTEQEVTDTISVIAQLRVHEDELHILGQAGNLAILDDKQFARWIDKTVPNFLKRALDSRRLLDQKDGDLIQLLRASLDEAGIPSTEALTKAGPLDAESLAKLGKKVDIPEDTPFFRMREAEGQLREWLQKARKTLAETGERLAPPEEILRPFGDAVDEFNAILKKSIFAAGGEKSKAYFEVLRDLQAQHLAFVRAYDAAGDAVPLAQIPRVLTDAEFKRLQTVLGAGTDDGELRKILAGLRATKARKADDLVVQHVNEAIQKLRNFHLERGGRSDADKFLKALMEVTPELAFKYSETPHTGLLASMAGFQQMRSISEGIDDFVKRGLRDEATDMVVGELMVAGSRQHPTGVGPKFGRRNTEGVIDDLTVSIEVVPERWVIIKDAAGRIHRVSLEAAENEQMIVLAGKGESAGMAAASELAKTGTLRAEVGSTADMAKLGKVAAAGGTQVIVSNKNVMNAMTSALHLSHDMGGGVLRAYDSIHALLKANATIVRPDFHAFNALSSVPMLMMNGASMRSVIGGYRDAMSFISKDPVYTDALARLGRLERDTTGWIRSTVTGAAVGAVSGFLAGGFDFGTAGFTALAGGASGHALAKLSKPIQRVARQARLAGGLENVRPAAEGVYEINGKQVDVAELLKIMGEEGLFGGVTREIFGTTRETAAFVQGAKGEPRRVLELLDDIRKNGAKGKGGELRDRTIELMSHMGEAPEILMRVAGTFAFMRQGYSPRQAVQAALRSLIDYGDLTPIEAKFAKRIWSFYSFPRKMIPMSARHLNRHPGRVAAQVKLLYNLPGSESELGALIQRGDAIGLEDYRVNLQRAIPNLDLLSTSAHAMDWLWDWDDVNGSLESVGQPSFRLGIPANLVGEAFYGEGKSSFGKILREGMRSSYLTRWTMEQAKVDPLATTTSFDKFVGHVFGVKKGGVELRRRWIKGQRKFIEAEMKARLNVAESDGEVDDIVRELIGLRESEARLLGR